MILNAALGLAGEAGEFANEVKKVHFHGHETDKDKLIEELGDVLYYVAMAALELNVPLDAVAKKNVAKLAARYPQGFDPERSRKRDAK